MVLKCECVRDTFLHYDYTNPCMQIHVENALLWIIQHSFHEIMTKRKCKQAFCLLWTLNNSNCKVLKIVLELRSYALLNFPFKKA